MKILDIKQWYYIKIMFFGWSPGVNLPGRMGACVLPEIRLDAALVISLIQASVCRPRRKKRAPGAATLAWLILYSIKVSSS